MPCREVTPSWHSAREHPYGVLCTDRGDQRTSERISGRGGNDRGTRCGCGLGKGGGLGEAAQRTVGRSLGWVWGHLRPQTSDFLPDTQPGSGRAGPRVWLRLLSSLHEFH